MTNGKRARNKNQRLRVVTKLHIIKKSLARGDRYYIYAWRGGPRIHVHDGGYPVITPEILAKQLKAKSARHKEAGQTFEQVISGYRASPQYLQLRKITQYEYRRWLNRISSHFGEMPLIAFDHRETRRDIIEWKNLWSSQPRTADTAAFMMSLLLGWAVENSLLKVNVAAKIKTIHKVNRSDLIWEERHWNQVEQADPPLPAHLMDALRVASWTGLRLTDLCELTWDEVGPKAIIKRTSKRDVRAVIPILPPLRNWIDQIPEEKRTGTVLKNSRGWKWTKSGLGGVFQKRKPQNFDRTIHDLRGTFCTMLIQKGLTDEQAAMVMGWDAKRVGEIRARYVDEERVIVSLLDKLTG